MSGTKNVAIPLLNKAAESEHAARVKLFTDLGIYSEKASEPAIETLKKLVALEESQKNKFRIMIEDYLSSVRQTCRLYLQLYQLETDPSIRKLFLDILKMHELNLINLLKAGALLSPFGTNNKSSPPEYS